MNSCQIKVNWNGLDLQSCDVGELAHLGNSLYQQYYHRQKVLTINKPDSKLIALIG